MKSFKIYGNYYGNNYSGDNYKLEPIDGVDFVTFMHDIDHRIMGGNNRYADRKVAPRMRYILNKQKITIAGKAVAYMAIYVYSIFYAKIIRDSFIGKILESKGIMRDARDEQFSFDSHVHRLNFLLNISGPPY
jgi:hypothetical protein